MTALDIATEPATHAQLEREAQLVVEINNTAIANCQRILRETAAILGRLGPPMGPLAAQHYRSAAELLDAMRML